MASAAKSLMQTLRRYIPGKSRAPSPIQNIDRRFPKPSSTASSAPPPPLPKPLSPLLYLKPFTTFKYFARDQRRNRLPIKHSVLTKADVEKIMKEKSFDPIDFPRPYLTAKVVEDDNAIGGGYQK